MPLLVHGGVTDPRVDLFDRESLHRHRPGPCCSNAFAICGWSWNRYITTRDAAEFVAGAGPRVVATITAHHLLYNRNAIFLGACGPTGTAFPSSSARAIGKRWWRQPFPAIKILLGTDSAPHARLARGSLRLRRLLHRLRCAGALCRGLRRAGAIDRLEGFASFHGADWYGLPRNSATVTLVREEFAVPAHFPYAGGDTWSLCGLGKPSNGGCCDPFRFLRLGALLVPLSLAGCINDGATYQLDQTGKHNLSLVREQTFLWDNKVKFYLVVARMPNCMRRHLIGEFSPKTRWKSFGSPLAPSWSGRESRCSRQKPRPAGFRADSRRARRWHRRSDRHLLREGRHAGIRASTRTQGRRRVIASPAGRPDCCAFPPPGGDPTGLRRSYRNGLPPPGRADNAAGRPPAPDRPQR